MNEGREVPKPEPARRYRVGPFLVTWYWFARWRLLHERALPFRLWWNRMVWKYWWPVGYWTRKAWHALRH